MIAKTSTGYVISPYNMGDCRLLEDYLSIIDETADTSIPYGYIVHDNALYIPNIDIERFLPMLHEKTVSMSPPVRWKKMSQQYSTKYEPRDATQKNVISFLTGGKGYEENKKAHQLAVLLKTGGGKEQPYSSILPTPTGRTTMGEIKIGDIIFDANGNPTKVLEIHEQGVKDVYQITFSDGRICRCGLHHLWNIYFSGSSKVTTLTLDRVIEIYRTRECYIQLCKPVVYNMAARAIINKTQEISPEILYGEPFVRRAYLQQVLKDYGTDNHGTTRLVGGERYIQEMAYLIRSLGDMCVVIDENTLVHIPGENAMLKIVDIRQVGREQCRCLVVDNKDHLYLTDDFIVTHNTFTTVYGITQMNRKALIVTHMTKIKDQWISTLTKMFDYPKDMIMELTSNDLQKAFDGTDLGKDVYFISHQTITRWITSQSPTSLNTLLARLGIGVKVIDEYHLHWRNSLILDMFTNVDKTIYLTATFDRSDGEQSRLFRRITASIPTYGTTISTQDKHVEYHPITYTTKCPFPKVKSFSNGMGMGIRKWLVAKWFHHDDPEDTTNKIIFSLIEKCLQSEGRILVTVGSIDASDMLAAKIQQQYPDYIVDSINSHKSAKRNDEVKEKADIIVSTIQSSGTGVDIRKLRYIINAETYSSRVTAEQFIGRLRPYFNNEGEQLPTYMFDLVDKSIIYCNIYYKARYKRLKELAKTIQPLEY